MLPTVMGGAYFWQNRAETTQTRCRKIGYPRINCGVTRLDRVSSGEVGVGWCGGNGVKEFFERFGSGSDLSSV